MVDFCKTYEINKFDRFDDFCSFDIKDAKCIKIVKCANTKHVKSIKHTKNLQINEKHLFIYNSYSHSIFYSVCDLEKVSS